MSRRYVYVLQKGSDGYVRVYSNFKKALYQLEKLGEVDSESMDLFTTTGILFAEPEKPLLDGELVPSVTQEMIR